MKWNKKKKKRKISILLFIRCFQTYSRHRTITITTETFNKLKPNEWKRQAKIYYRDIFENLGKKVIRRELLSLECWLTTKYLVTIRKRDFGQQRYCYDSTLSTSLIQSYNIFLKYRNTSQKSYKKKKKTKEILPLLEIFTREINEAIYRPSHFFVPSNYIISIGC